jgi:aminoglycoside/choline kinase family phosphotransferase
MKERLIELFEQRFGHLPDVVRDLAADGSTRKYFRLIGADEQSTVGAFGPDPEENRAFLSFAKSLRDAGLPVPAIYAEDQKAGVWLEEDLGDTTLFRALSAARVECVEDEFPADIEQLYRQVLSILPRFQVLGNRVVDYSVAYPRQAFDRQSIRWDLNYFKYHFLKLAHVPFNEQRLEDDFSCLVAHVLEADSDFFLYRDFQSRNIMIRETEPWFVDFQGGRKGAPHYDVASLLYDAKANVPPAVRSTLLEHYLDALGEYTAVDRAAFRRLFPSFVLVRLMQAMGAYGYRGFFERKQRFLESVPHAAQNLEYLLAEGLPVALPELELVFRHIAERWARHATQTPPLSGLAVLIQSFSFRDGYPPDVEGHGGGFVFDCRALPNPHWVPELTDLTGETDAVAEYLERSPAVQEFWDNMSRMVEAQVEAYAQKGYASLTVSFGCTGGRHRSVFMATRLGRHLAQRYPQIGVRVRHSRI